MYFGDVASPAPNMTVAERFLAKLLDLCAKGVIDDKPDELRAAIPRLASPDQLRAIVVAVEAKNAGKPNRAAATAAIRAALEEALAEHAARVEQVKRELDEAAAKSKSKLEFTEVALPLAAAGLVLWFIFRKR